MAMAQLTCILKTFVFLICLATIDAQLPTTKPMFYNTGCYFENGNYTENSTYHNNLKLSLLYLITGASNAPFDHSSAGLADGLNAAYSQYYCRGDISTKLCHDCVESASQIIVSIDGACFGKLQGVVYYQECTVRYANFSIVGLMEDFPQTWNTNGVNVSDPRKFNEVFGSIMSSIINKAAYGNGSGGFATGQGMVTQFEPLYCLVQCSPDILGSPCETCLQSALRYVGQCCGYEVDLRFVYYPSCQIRYSLTPFYFNTTSPFAPPPVPEPPNPPHSDAPYYVTRVGVPVAAGLVLVAGVLFFFYRRKVHVRTTSKQIPLQKSKDAPPEEPDVGNIVCFSLTEIEDATTKFSLVNKLGQGGFGSVYKGILPNGQFIAVKRLSRNSGQGIREFKTEIAVVAKLQHRNLVRLLGYCIEQDERILVYEFLPNLSLDKQLFDATKSKHLDWRTRYRIIEGILRGLRYLHIDSLLTIVHRDLKSSNILLDQELNPKIADFGLAKLVNIDETTENTSRVAGTYGYMAPEYALTGRYSTKSDIYSFGVIVLEILTGKSVGRFYDSVSGNGLLHHHAWRLWTEREIEALVDPILESNYSRIEVERCAQISLLCIQDDIAKRPTVRSLIGMLENNSLELPYPSAPSTFSLGIHTTTRNLVSQGVKSQSSQMSSLYSEEFGPR